MASATGPPPGASDEASPSVLDALADLRRRRLPLIVLIGGTTGTGKSTIATEVAHRLGITRVSSTDIIRQTMRAFLSPDVMPTIHHSSFEAGYATAGPGAPDALVEGFLDQSRQVCVGVEAMLTRTVVEKWSMVLEGVHLVPGLLPPRIDGAVVVPLVVTVGDGERHRSRFHVRDESTGGLRPIAKYLDRLEDIRRIQAHIVERARSESVPIVENTDMVRATDEVLELVRRKAAGRSS